MVLIAVIPASAAPVKPSSSPEEATIFDVNITTYADKLSLPDGVTIVYQGIVPPDIPLDGSSNYPLEFEAITRDDVLNYGKCETSSASPTLTKIEAARKKVVAMGDNLCVIRNMYKSECSTIASYKGGALGLCGGFLYGINCKWIAWAAAWVAKTCVNHDLGDRAGGTWFFSPQMRAVIF